MPWKKPFVEAERARFCAMVAEARQRSLAMMCRRFGISRKTGYKWWRRAQAGASAWSDGSHRRQTTSAQRPRWWPELMREKARQPEWGARKLRWQLQRSGRRGVPAVRTLHRWLKQAGVVQPPRVRLPGPWRTVPPPGRARRCNDLWTVDFKGKFRCGDGTFIHALTVCDRASHFILGIIQLHRPNEVSIMRAFRRLFRRYGMPRALLMDRGAPWWGLGPYHWTRLSVWWLRLGITPRFTRRAAPQDNAHHEQMHRMLKAGTARPPAPTAAAQQRRFDRWRQRYNFARPHESLADQPPGTRYQASARPYTGRLQCWAYAKPLVTVRVHRSGCIFWQQRLCSIGRAFHCHPVGLRLQRDGATRVYFGPHWLGLIFPHTDHLSPVRLTSVPARAGLRPSLPPSP